AGGKGVGAVSYQPSAFSPEPWAMSRSAPAAKSSGVVEGVELSGDRFVVGVQWHPERLYADSKSLFDEFISACVTTAAKESTFVPAKNETCRR
ncbi:MAG: gamma-glutamyl-gamma-aminobutyrate hydrolase family protein, partial [Candidatus Obscuribacterales bacterium]|nr:gamma-glutamyl-gamma-aminobutyrate hydrolase family protein [Candidatus Obscuribacterales bacterium]